jgi:polysaccharide biosynthesis protein PslH
VRTLVVAEQYPWPAADGYRQRLHHLVNGLRGAGEVDVVSLHRAGTAPIEPPPIDGVTAPLVVPVGPDAGPRSWWREWIGQGVPRRLLGPDWSDLRAAVSEGRLAAADLVWFSHVDTWWALADLFPGVPAVVDFDNLENLALRLRRKIPPRPSPGAGPAERARVTARWGLSRAMDLVDERRWERLQHRCAAAVERVVVCSRLDVERSGCPNAVVVPNGASPPADPRSDRRSLVAASPTFLFVGALDYEPNTEAVEWFVRDVLPLVRREVPDARFRVVGRGCDLLGWTSSVPGVELVGPVADLDAELRRADVSVVPIRVGAGTRLKVLEALANRLPLVSTRVGCEGIELVDGEHALLADDATSFAASCVALALDGDLRQRLADTGAVLFAQSYDWSHIERDVAELARELVSPNARE